MKTRLSVVLSAVVALALGGALVVGVANGPGDSAAGAQRAPGLKIRVLTTGLDRPWDVQQLPTGQLLLTQRNRATLTVVSSRTGRKRNLAFPSNKVWVSGETGLLGLAVDPAFTRTRTVYTCSGWNLAGGRHDVRVIAWRLDTKLRRATLRRTLLAGLPTTSGRHGGCRLLVGDDGHLYVGTGDAAVGTHPRDLDSLGGKVLRIDRTTGAPVPGNPFFDGSGPRRYVWTYGHRNVQGLARRSDGQIYSVEHGSDRDDEVNRIEPGRDFGWNPVPGYNESVPMTDQSLPGTQTEAVWSSGRSTIAPSGADFVRGRAWGSLRGTLAVAVLKERRMLFMRLAADGTLRSIRTPAALQRYGRLRDVTSSRGVLYVTTDNGDGRDVLLKIRPR